VIGESSSNAKGSQYFKCQGYGHLAVSVLNDDHSGWENLSEMGIYQGYIGDIFKKSDVKVGL